MSSRFLSLLLLLLAATGYAAPDAFERAVADFFAGRIEDSVRGFDEVARQSPESAPQLWQRGIALYYAGRYEDCRAQFESHRTVNPNDVENAAWHFLCVARAASPAQARKFLLPVGPDSRKPMRQIYAMFKGDLTPERVMAAADSSDAQFYAHLYVGLYYEALGRSSDAREHLQLAADEHGDYMQRVAAVHLKVQPEVWMFDRIDRLGSHLTKVLGAPRLIDGKGGKAIEFDGVDDALFVDVHPLAGASTFTWEVIFRPDKGGSKEQRFFHLQEKGSDNRLLFETRLTENEWYLDSYVMSRKGSKALIRPDRRHPLGNWYHIAATYDGKTFRNYVDGELEGEALVDFDPHRAGQSSVGVRINLKDYFKGAVYKARFTRRALRPDEFMK